MLRSKRRSNPLWISTGNRVSLDSAGDGMRRCDTGYRLPEPTRQAHLAANEARRAGMPAGMAKDGAPE